MSGEGKMKVLLTTNIPSPYFVDYADCLGKKCELTVLFEMSTASDRSKSWYGEINNKSFKSVFLNALPITPEAGLSFRILRFLDSGFDKVIIANPTTPTGIIALLYCRIKRIHFMLQSEGGFRGSGKGIKEKFKKFIMEKADLYLSGMQGESDYFLSYGATEKTLRWYPFTSLDQEQIDQEIITEADKECVKKELKIREKQVVISVGRPIKCKGFDVLLQSKKNLPDEIGFYIVGGTPSQEYLDIIEKYDLKNVHFIDHCEYSTLRKYYHAADVFALPTRGDTWGLVINEAMASGLPVITTDRCVAGLQLINNGENGFIISCDDCAALSAKIGQILNDDALKTKMSKRNLEKIQEYTIENMAIHVWNAICS